VWITVGVIAFIALSIIGVVPSFLVRVPEGVNGLLARSGRYYKTLPSGAYFLPPWLPLTHLVTRREIPFDVPVVEALTRDDIRASVDILVTFSIEDPYRFVYSISAFDFDQVFQAACQDSLRRAIRALTADQVIDLARQNLKDLQEALSADMEAYGVKICNVSVTYAQPQAEFVSSREARQLAIVQQAEQAERQTLAQKRQADEEELARQRVIAEVARERERLQVEMVRAQAQQQIEELRAQAEALRLAHCEERLKAYPRAAEWEASSARLEVARALAGNTRAIVQMSNSGEVANALMVSEIMRSVSGDQVTGEHQPA
jgi:regulator of protease activity HflC (stomatin/prohibitin superfamily)